MANEEIGALLVRIEADMKDFQSKMDKAINIMDDTQKRANSLSQGIKNAFTFAGGFVVFDLIKKGFEGSVKAGFEFDKVMEQNKIAFESMLGSAEKANNILGKLSKMAAETPFEFPELATAAKKMLAFGFEAQKIPGMLKNVGDAAAGLGLGADGVNRITVALGQMQAKGKVSAQEMMQLTETGIPAWDLLAKAMGKSTAEVMKLSEQGLLPARKSIDILVAGMEEKFPNMMDKQSKSFAGLMSTVKDNVQITFGKILEPAFNKMTSDILPALIKNLDSFTKRIGDEGVGSAVKDLVLSFDKLLPLLAGVSATLATYKVISTIDAAMKAWKVSTIAMTYAQGGLNAVLAANPIGAVATAIGLLVAAISYLVMKQQKAINDMKNQLVDGYVKERDIAIAAIDEQHKARVDSINDSLETERNAHDKRLSNIQSEYDKQIKASGDAEQSIRKNIQERKALLDKNHNDTIQQIREEYGVEDIGQKSKTEMVKQAAEDNKTALDKELNDTEESVRNQEEAYRKMYDNNVKDAEKAYKTKSKLLDDEYIKSLRLIDDDLANKVEGLNKEIDNINNKTEEEDKILKDQQNAEKIANLQSIIDSAKTADEKAKAEKDLSDEIKRVNREKELDVRKTQIESLRDQIDEARKNAEIAKENLKTAMDEKKTTLDTEKQEALTREKELLDDKILKENAKLDEVKKRIANEKIEIDKDSAAKILIIQNERIAKEEAENKKYDAAKSALDKEETANDGYKERYIEQLNEQLKLKQNMENEKFKAVEERIKKEQEAEQKAIDEAKKRVEEKTEIKIDTAKLDALQAEYDRLAKIPWWQKSGQDSVKMALLAKQIEDEKKRLHNEGVPGFANGVKNFRGGLALVGERGPELVKLPKGSDVMTNKQTEQMLGNVNFEGMFKGAVFNVRSDTDAKLIAREIYNLTQGRNRGNGVIPAT